MYLYGVRAVGAFVESLSVSKNFTHMMNSHYTKALAAGLVSVLALGVTAPAFAQGGPREYQKKALDCIKQKEWANALDLLTHCIRVYEPRVKQLGLDDGFGWFYYQKGVCLLSLGKPAEAVTAFKDCYTKYPDGKKNQLGKMALFREGVAYCQLNDFVNAAATLEKFASEYRTDPVARKAVHPGELQGYLAQCYFKQPEPDFEKGVKALTEAESVRYKGRIVGDSVLATSFACMVDAGIDSDRPDDVIKFAHEHPACITIAPNRVGRYIPRLIGQAAKAMEKSRRLTQEGKQKEADKYASLGVTLMSLVADQQTVMADCKKTLERLGAAPGVVEPNRRQVTKTGVEGVVTEFEKMESEGKTLDSYMIGLMGNQAMIHGSNRMGRAAYQLMDDYFPNAANKEDNLYFLVMTTWQLGDVDKGNELLHRHLTEFPKSKYAATLNTMSLQGLLEDKKFKLCIEQADKVMKLHADNPRHNFYELALYCKGASLFNLGIEGDHDSFKKCVPELERFIKEYPESKYLKPAMYLVGEAYTNLGKRDEAINAFTKYIARFPDKTDDQLGNVLHARAYNYLTREKDGDQELAKKDAQEIVENFKNHKLFPYANNLLANLCQSSKDSEEQAKAEGYYLAALESAKKLEDRRPAAEAIYNLLMAASTKPLPTGDKAVIEEAKKAARDAVKKWNDEYWQYGDTEGNRYSLQTAAAVMDFFKEEQASFDPAMKKLQELIVREGKKDDPKMIGSLEEAGITYTKLFLEGHKLQGREVDEKQLRDHFYRFPGVDNGKDKMLSSMLRMSVIAQSQDAYEKAPTETAEQRAKRAAQAGLIAALFDELGRDFQPSDLPPFTLIKLGMNLANSDQPEKGIVYFNEILNPTDPQRSNAMLKYRQNAIFGKAVALGNSKDNAKIDEAIKMMREVLSSGSADGKAPDRKSLEDARYNLVKFTTARKDWPAVIAAAEEYREEKYKKNEAEVLYLQALAYIENNQVDKAIVNLMNLNSSYKGLVKWSGPALLTQMDVLWERNKPSEGRGKQPSDRYVAWRTGEQYVKLLDTPGNRAKMTAEDSEILNKVKAKVEKFGSDAIVSQERAQVAEHEAAKRRSRGQD